MKFVQKDPKRTSNIAVIFNCLKQFSETVTLRFSEEGIYVQGLDGSHVSLFEWKLTSGWFTEYEWNGEDDVSESSVSTGIMHKVISTFHQDQTMMMEIESDSDKLSLSFTEGKDTCDKHFELPLIDIDSDIMTIPDKDSDIDLVISSKKFSELVAQFEIFDSTLSFKFTDEDIIMKASGVDGSMTASMSLDDVTEFAMAEDKDVIKQAFALKYIRMMSNFSKISNETMMEFTIGSPMTLKYDMAEDSYIKFYLAPKVDFDDDED